MSKPLPTDSDEILGYETVLNERGDETRAIRIMFRDGSEQIYEGDDADLLVPMLRHVTPPTA
ncbi:MAG TPA: hypothetical protein VM120_16030 [Bryobacteraceae bacterium]|nr:hypothetical protein [Bryobacteraceae bacterium]